MQSDEKLKALLLDLHQSLAAKVRRTCTHDLSNGPVSRSAGVTWQHHVVGRGAIFALMLLVRCEEGGLACKESCFSNLERNLR